MQKNTIKYTALIALMVLGTTIVGCKKFVETDAPVSQVNGNNVYTSDATAIAALTGIYIGMFEGIPSPNFSTGPRSFSLLCGLSADEFTLFTGANTEKMSFYKNTLVANSANNNVGTDYWNSLYDNIYSTNSAIEGLNGSKGLTETVKQQLLGEAKFMRAFFYFYLVNLYGDVPLVTSTDYKINAFLARSTAAQVYQQVIKDLNEATDLLSDNYMDGSLKVYTGVAERVRPTKWAAKALLARTYLYIGNYADAEIQSTDVINNTTLYDTVSINNVFLKNSKEAIWQIQPTKINQNTDDSRMFIVTTGFSDATPIWLSDTLLNSFEANDLRRSNGNWVNSTTISGKPYYYPYKYKNITSTVSEYLMVLRLSEQYLIRAEARTQQGNFNGAQSDLNIIRKRARLPGTTASDKNSLLTAILHERQVEFFSEWGHRWLDLKRTNTADALMSTFAPKKGGTWNPTNKLYPVPFLELQRDPNLIQNSGY